MTSTHCKAYIWCQLFPRRLSTLQSLCGQLNWEIESCPVPAIPITFGKDKFIETKWGMLDDSRGWGVRPVVEAPVGVALEDIDLPDWKRLGEETWSLLRMSDHGPVWRAEAVLNWLSSVEAEPEGYDAATQGEYNPIYANLSLDNVAWQVPALKWVKWTAPVDPEPAGEQSVGVINDVDAGATAVRKFSQYSAEYSSILGSERVGRALDQDLVRTMLAGSLTRNSWRGIKSLHNKILECRRSTGKPLVLPWSETDWIHFVSWLSSFSTAATAKAYTGRIGSLHAVLGWQYTRPEIVSRILTGLSNVQILSRQDSVQRGEVTPAMMKELRTYIKSQSWPLILKRLIWCLITWLYVGECEYNHYSTLSYYLTILLSGCFRISEILAPSKHVFTREQTPTWRDVSMKKKVTDGETWEMVMVKLRASKTNTEVTLVDLIQNKSCPQFCPVTAFKKLKAMMLDCPRDLPIFTVSLKKKTPTFLTPRDFNNILTVGLTVDRSQVKISTHSFRRCV